MRYLSYRDCLKLDVLDHNCYMTDAEAKGVYQQVFGRAPTQQEYDQIVQSGVIKDGKSFIDLSPGDAATYLQGTPQGVQNQALTMANQAQAAQVAANQPAIATLQGQGQSLADQYKSLLASVTKQGEAAFNTATSGENAFLGQRGLISQSGLGNNELSQTQNTVNTTNAANQGQIQAAATNAQVPISQAIASLQAGNLPQAENFAGGVLNTQAGITNTNTQAQEALQAAQLAASKPFGVGNLVFAPASNTFKQPGTGGGGYGGGESEVLKLAQKVLAGKSKSRPSMGNMGQFVQ